MLKVFRLTVYLYLLFILIYRLEIIRELLANCKTVKQLCCFIVLLSDVSVVSSPRYSGGSSSDADEALRGCVTYPYHP